MSEHRPERGDQVEAYIKRWRDRFEGDASSYALAGRGVLDDLLDDYRLHADTGTPLAADVPSPHGAIEYTSEQLAAIVACGCTQIPELPCPHRLAERRA